MTTNRGAMALQAVIDERHAAGRSIQWELLLLAGGINPLLRWIDGEVVPDDSVREVIGRITDGAVAGPMWDQTVEPAAPDEIPVEDERALIAGAAPDPVIAAPVTPALLCELGGPLGTVPAGPLVRAIIDPAQDGRFVLAGPGFALVLDEAVGWAVRDATTAGLADLRHQRSERLAAAMGVPVEGIAG